MAAVPAPSRRWRHRTRRRRVALAIWAGLATFAILILLDGLWAGRTLVRGLTRARSELTVGIGSLVTGSDQAGVNRRGHAASAVQRSTGSPADEVASSGCSVTTASS